MASKAMLEGSYLQPLSNTGISKFFPCVLICQTAPALKLSQAANITESLAFLSLQATLAKLVDFPTPFTPINTITYGFNFDFYLLIYTTKSIFFFGVNNFFKASYNAYFTVACTVVNDLVFVSIKVFPTAYDIFYATSWATFFYNSFLLNSPITSFISY